MRINRLIATTASLALLAVGTLTSAPAMAEDNTGLSQNEADAVLALVDATTPAELRAASRDAALPDETAQLAREVATLLPAGTDLTAEGPVESAVDYDAVVRNAIRSAIDGTQYQCEGTALSEYSTSLLMGPLGDFDIESATQEELEAHINQIFTLLFYTILGGLDGATYDLLFNANDPRFSRFGAGDVNQTADLQRSFFELKNFWDINARNIRLEPLKSTVILSSNLDDRTRWGKGAIASITPENIPATDTPEHLELYRGWADTLAAFQEDLPWMDASNPIYTFNAFAFDPAGESPAFSKFGKIIAYGDGLLTGQAEFGLIDVGPEAVLGHEYGHQVQYSNKVFGTASTPEATRRTELMADAYGAYFAAHKEGLALNGRRLSQVVRSFEEVGDCGFDSPGHHGTPLQRQKSAIWGVELAQDAPCVTPKGKATATLANGDCRLGVQIIATKQLQREFDVALPGIVAPDA
ncbi:hypothetical protein [Nocardioides sp. GXZ039]|uniref:hypothetical protein n=1 Tax=Nocardioides sp. GXZ039 TaxID=3136018 RepID=UPI0030F39B74